MKTWQLLWRLVCYRPWLYLLTGALAMIVFLFELVPGLIVREFFNTLSGNSSVNVGLWGLIALLAVSGLVRIVSLAGAIISSIIFRFTTSALLRKNMFARILEHPGAQALPTSPSEAISRFCDDVNEITVSMTWFNNVIGLTAFAAVSFTIMIRINPVITLVVFFPMIVVVVAANKGRMRIEAYRQKSLQATSDIVGFLGDLFNTTQAVQVAGAEESVIERFRRLNQTRRQVALRDRFFTTLLDSFFYNTVNIGTGIILLLAGQSIQAGTFRVGDFALFVYFLGYITDWTGMFGMALAKYKQIGVSFARMQALLYNPSPETIVKHGPVYMSGPLPTVPIICKSDDDDFRTLKVVGLTYRYPDTQRGIDNISFDLERGSFTVITGRIGSGKTTLLRALLGLLPKQAGSIYWNSHLVTNPAAFFVPPRCAYTPQVPRLFSEKLKDNILLGLPEDCVDLPTALHLAALEPDVASMEQGLDTLIGPRGVRLSGGQVQRTAAARMFVRGAELLVFDDLSSALDVETEQILWERLLKQRDITCLVVSHRPAALRHANHILILKDGKVDAEGNLPTLLQTCPELQQLWTGDRDRATLK